MRYDKCLYFNLNSLTRRLNKVWEEEFAKLRLSAAHAYCLRYVLGTPGIALKDLAAELDLSPSTVTRFIDALEKQGFVHREPSAEDARVIGVWPSKKGRQLEVDLDRAMSKLTQHLLSRLGKKNVEDLVSIVHDYRGKMEIEA